MPAKAPRRRRKPPAPLAGLFPRGVDVDPAWRAWLERLLTRGDPAAGQAPAGAGDADVRISDKEEA